MKLDGHTRLTNEAIRALKSRCSTAVDKVVREKICQLPQFSVLKRNWEHLGRSNKMDNDKMVLYSIIEQLTVLSEHRHKLEHGFLTRKVMSVDLEILKVPYHFLDTGQKYHFMRREKGATVKQAHLECVEFIRAESKKWLEMMNRAVNFPKSHGRSKYAHITPLKKRAVGHLAIAIHALQDSFSTGHTKRAPYSNPSKPGAIQDIYIYNNQDSHEHSHDDFKTGDLQSIAAQAAINATVALLWLCISSLANKRSSLNNWAQFQNQWLALSPTVR